MTEWIILGTVLAVIVVGLFVLVWRGMRDKQISLGFFGRLLHFSARQEEPSGVIWRTIQSWEVKPGDSRNVGKTVVEHKFSGPWRIRYGTRPDAGSADRRFHIAVRRKKAPQSMMVVVDLREPVITRDQSGQVISETGTFVIEIDAVTRWWTAVIEEQEP